jgi:hypothetical protein
VKTSIHCFDSCILRYMRHTGVVVLLTAVHFLLSCAPKPEVTPQTPAPTTPPKTLAAPSDLTARPFYRRINLSWNTNRHESSVSSGYNVYLFSEKDSLEGVNGGFRLLTLEPYPGDTDPNLDRESYPLEGLENGTIYRAYVTTVYPDGKETPRSNIVEAIPRPESGFTLRESFKGNESGYSFRKLKSVPTDDPDNDIYLANINDALWVASPRRINVILRQTKFFSMSSYSTLEEVDLTTMGRKPESVLKIIGGLMFVLQDEEGSYALVRVESVDSKSKLAKMSFVYQSRPGTLKFR